MADGGQAGGLVALLIGAATSIAVAVIAKFGRSKDDTPPAEPAPQPVTALFLGQLDAVAKQVDGHERRLGRHDDAVTRIHERVDRLDERLDQHEEREHRR